MALRRQGHTPGVGLNLMCGTRRTVSHRNELAMARSKSWTWLVFSGSFPGQSGDTVASTGWGPTVAGIWVLLFTRRLILSSH